MAIIQIPDALDENLQIAADLRGCLKDQLVRHLLTEHLAMERNVDPDLTDVQVEHLQHSLAQADRGEFATDDQVQAIFRKWSPARNVA